VGIGLDPVVIKRLQQFGRRRRRLIVTRGVCAGIVSFLLAVSIVAMIDWYWLLDETVRWGLSGGLYLTVLTTIWITCLRRMIHVPATEELAARVEQAEPQLRENLLSAVELATDDPASLHDSPVFRGLLQDKVAQQLGQTRIPALLPARLVAGWAIVTFVLLAAAVVLLMSGDDRIRQLAARAILPGANIARVSRIQVEVMKPTPHSLTLAEDETVAVVVDVTGGRVDQVVLETFTANQGAVRQTMHRQGDTEFAANIHVADESVDYRILAGDAITRRFTIQSRPRPRVTKFHKTYTYPEYALLPDSSVTEDHGDILVLQGTTTKLVIELDQDVSRAELRIDSLDVDDLSTIPLVPQAATAGQTRQWTATIPVNDPAIYKVHLVSQETGFENTFSPKYEIRPQPDLIPKVGFLDQQESTLLLPPNDILALKAAAEDDLPLVNLQQQISVNGHEWETVDLDATPVEDNNNQLVASWQWDLLEHRLKTGDQLTTRLVATDRKGNRGESVPLRIIVSAPDFDPDRHAIMEGKLGLYDRLSDFAELLATHKTTALELIERMRIQDGSEDQFTVDRATLIDLASKQNIQAGEVLKAIQQVERAMPAGTDAYDLDLTGRVIARLQNEYANVPAYLLAAMDHVESPKDLKRDWDELKRVYERTADDAKNVALHYQEMATHNFLNSVALDLAALLDQQRLVVDSPTQTWTRLLRQETVVVNQLRILTELLDDQRGRLPASLNVQMRNLISWAESHREKIRDAMESEDKLDDLKRTSVNLFRELQSKQRMDILDGGLPGRLTGGRRDFQNRSGGLHVPLEQLAQAMRQENRVTVEASESKDSANGNRLLSQAERYVAEIDLKHRHSLDQFPIRRELTSLRTDSDSQYATDAGLAHRAVVYLLGQHRSVPPKESTIPDNLAEIAPAYRTLEAGHNLALARGALDSLLGMERWESQSIRARIDHPRQWDFVSQAFETASQRLKEAKVENSIVSQLDQIRWSPAVRDASRKIGGRRWIRDTSVSAGHELVEIRGQLTEVFDAVQPAMADARAVLAKYAPTIPQMARQAADQLRQMEQETTDTADAAEDTDSSEQPPRLDDLQQQQRDVNQQLEDLFQALAEDANVQDLLDDEQRERARDADDSIAMIREPAQQMNRALETAEQAESGQEQSTDLALAAEHQEQTAKALEAVADHYERLQNGQDVAESRADLRQNEREQGIARQMDQRFNDAEQLAQTASQDSQKLLDELEAELQRNPAMQQALSDISANALRDAQSALEYAAQDDENLQRANEKSDTEFQDRKRELVAEIRQMAVDATRLADTVVAQARDAAARGKTPHAQTKLKHARERLREAAAKGHTARDDQLLADLAQTAREASDMLTQASDTLTTAKQSTATGKDESIHADDKALAAAKKDAEKRRKQFHEQQKRTARDLAKRADDVKRRSDQAVKNAQNQLRSSDRRVQQAQNNLERKPDDANLKRAVEREQTKQKAEQQKVDTAKTAQQEAVVTAQQARKDADVVNRKPLPALNAKNPQTQSADEYVAEALTAAEKLKRTARQLVDEAGFGNELKPTRNQLASSESQQAEVTEDVSQAAQDVARAGRHERRLNNPAAADPLQNAANDIQQVAENESTTAESQLSSATGQAEQREAADQADREGSNGEALKAQQALQTSEEAIARQAEQLAGVVDPLLAAADAEQNAQTAASDAAAQSASSQKAGEGDSTPGEAASSATSGQAESSGETGSGGQPSVPAPTAEQMATGRQMAQTLDELDRQLAAAASPSGQPPQAAASSPAGLDSISQAAKSQQAAMANARLQSQQQAAMALSQGGKTSADIPSATGVMEDFTLFRINRDEAQQWGKLRDKSEEDSSKGRSEAVSEEYRKSVETYFRVLAERARGS
jgi:hypothetical protein